jgi:hypothetical protein
MFSKFRLIDAVLFVISFVITKTVLDRKKRRRAQKARQRMY